MGVDLGMEGSPSNQPPVANNDAASTTKSGAVSIDVLTNDTDPNNDPLSVTNATNGESGTTIVNPDNTVTYTHGGGSTETDSFTYDVSDGNGGTASATVTVNVTAPPPPGGGAPTVTSCSPDNGNPNQRLTVTVTGSDFASGATVSFGSRIAVQDVTWSSSSQLDVLIKIHRRASSGGRTVTVTNPDGQSGAAGCFNVN